MKKKVFAFFMAMVMTLSLVACGGGSNAGGNDADNSDNSGDAAQTLKLGGIGPLTGSYANYGLSVQHGAQLAVDEINAAFKDAFADCAYYGYTDDEIVSGDIVGDTHGGVFDPTQTDVNTVDGVTMARTVAFYDNEYGFTSTMIRTLLYFAEISE